MLFLQKISFVLLTVFLLASCTQSQETEINTLQGELEKKHPTWESLKGQWLVINYWAVWCKPCREEIPELNHIANLPQVTMLGVNYDNTQGEVLKNQVEELRVQFTILLEDPSTKLGYPRPSVLPTTIIINPEGKLHQTLIGPQTEVTITEALNLTQ